MLYEKKRSYWVFVQKASCINQVQFLDNKTLYFVFHPCIEMVLTVHLSVQVAALKNIIYGRPLEKCQLHELNIADKER